VLCLESPIEIINWQKLFSHTIVYTKMPGYKKYAKRTFKPYRKTTSMVKKVVKNELSKQVEVKHNIEANSDSLFVTVGTVNRLCETVQGDDINERIGNKIFLKSIDIKGIVIPGQTGTFDICRATLVLSKDGTAPTLATLYDQTGSLYVAHPNQLYTENFKILGDKTVFVSAVETTFDSLYKKINFHKTFNNLPQVDSSGNDKNILYLVTLGTQTAVSTEHHIFMMSAMISYTDM